ncbi:LysR family transcriptional regulator [Devosia aurantiaca]|uniref:LysR family transcriptional regulator n=1 Tax=Devosia aurantiaca TaxID=2714858 RepID=A0A6M1SQ22_9HYPH|nr:LysR family transcriptional regulator [Devosia aurantiaca]NGP17305.1 LysR family transcriptional regulator [Devosia aurantiaca]
MAMDGKPREGRSLSRVQPKASDLTLHQLRIFWAVAHSETLTKAAKQLGLAQPSLSQQLGKLEANIGTLLFHRRSNEMELTEAGQFLLPKVEQVLRLISDLEDGLAQFSGGERLTLRIAGINSVLRVLVPPALRHMQEYYPGLDFDLQESSPAEILDMLYSRRVNVGLLATNSVAQASVGFVQVPLVEDPHVLVVPESLVLDGVTDPERELPPDQWTMLNRSIQFIFGSQQAQRVAEWYDKLLPQHHVVAKCRSFDTAIGLVGAGAGVCLAPGLTTVQQNLTATNLRLYRVQAPPRRIVALVPSQYRRTEPYKGLIETLQSVAARHAIPGLLETPPFLSIDAPSDL